MEDFHNSLYYAFSTIAQSLAALIGLLSAIALFRLQAIDSDLRERANRFAGKLGSYPLMEYDIAEERYGKFLDEVDKFVAGGTVKFTPVESASLLRMKKLVTLKPGILASFKLALGATAAIIAGSIGILSFTHTFTSQHAQEATLILCAGIVSMALALLLYAEVMRKLLK